MDRGDARNELRAARWQVEQWLSTARQELAKERLRRRLDALDMAIDALHACDQADALARAVMGGGSDG